MLINVKLELVPSKYFQNQKALLIFVKNYAMMKCKRKWLFFPLLIFLPIVAQANEWEKINYEIQTNVVASTGKFTPFWLVSNRHGLSSLENNSANLSAGLFRTFDDKEKFTWAYGVELAGAYNYSAPFYIQQLYADMKLGCWELSTGSKERWSEGKHRTLSGGGLTFSPNARPIPQIRLGITEYTTVPWWFNGWIQVRGHLSYGCYTDDKFQHTHLNNALYGTKYSESVLVHEKAAFLKIGDKVRSPLSAEIGLEMFSEFGGRVWARDKEQDILVYDLPQSYMEYIKALIPMPGGDSAPKGDQANINGNILGSWHLIAGYTADNWKLRAYYEHFFEDHSQMLGVSWVSDCNGVKRFLHYHPWQDGLWGVELEFPKGKWVTGVVAEFITSRDQSGPIYHDTNHIFSTQISGSDSYYNHYLYQSWQHWGMSICSPQFLSPIYNEIINLNMFNTRLRSYHLGIEGAPHAAWQYRMLASYTRHWGTMYSPLAHPMSATSILVEAAYTPSALPGWQMTGSMAIDHSELIGNNLGGMLTIRRYGILGR